MATNTVEGVLMCSDGFQIPLEAEIAEGTEASLTTNTTYSVVASAAGTFAPGKTITHGLIQADNGISYAYVLSEGLIAAVIPVSIKGVSCNVPQLCKPYTLKSGDQVRVLTLTAAARNAAVAVYTNTGTERIFAVTPSGAATNTFVDLQTGNGLGDTLQGQSILKAYGTSVDGSKIESLGAFAVDAKNNVVGSVPLSNPSAVQPMSNMSMPIPVALNFSLIVKTNA
jgi:hypothetical protein